MKAPPYINLHIKTKKKACKSPLQSGLGHSVRQKQTERVLALTDFATRLHLVDDVNAATATHDLAVAIAVFQSFQRVNDFHRTSILIQIRKMKPDHSGARPWLSSIKPASFKVIVICGT
jgi:hypothetical protein